MKTFSFASFFVSFVLVASLVACSSPTQAFPTTTPFPTYTPRPTYTPYPTVTPPPPTEIPPTEVPPTEVPPTETFPETVLVNGVDTLKLLKDSGFDYAGGTDIGGCTSSCVVYTYPSLGLLVDVYADSSMVFTVSFGGGFDQKGQASILFDLIDAIYGYDVNAWINSKNESVFKGSPQSGEVGNFSIYMEFYYSNLLVISIAQIN